MAAPTGVNDAADDFAQAFLLTLTVCGKKFYFIKRHDYGARLGTSKTKHKPLHPPSVTISTTIASPTN